MKPTLNWLKASGAEFMPEPELARFAQLHHYTAPFQEWGEGPPLVLVPGLAGGFELLGPLARLLASHFRVISYQLRGEDDCFALRRRFGLADLVEDLAEFLDCHCLERPAILGVSFGGVLALEFAARYPHRLRALAVQGVGARLDRSLLQRVASIVLADFPLPPDSPFINQFFNLLFGSRQQPGPLFQFVTHQCWQTDQSVMAHRFALIQKFNLENRLEKIQAPTLAMVGDRDLLVSESSLKSLCAGIRRNRLVRLPSCGHLAFVTHPGRVADELTQFLHNEAD